MATTEAAKFMLVSAENLIGRSATTVLGGS